MPSRRLGETESVEKESMEQKGALAKRTSSQGYFGNEAGVECKAQVIQCLGEVGQRN